MQAHVELERSWPVLAAVFAFGACVGSFLNVCIYRIPRGESIVVPSSHCPHCSAPIAWYDNIPLISFVILRGRCRHCQRPISLRYPVVELLTAVLFLAVWLRYGASGLTIAYWIGVGGLILGSFVDLEHMIIPDRVSLGGIAAGLLFSLLLPSLHGTAQRWQALAASAGGAALGIVVLWAIGVLGKLVFRREAMGLGDVKLLGAIGAFLGWKGVLFSIFASSVLGSLVGLYLVLSGRREWQSRIPYGPYLALGAVIWILWGPEIVQRYQSLIGFPV